MVLKRLNKLEEVSDFLGKGAEPNGYCDDDMDGFLSTIQRFMIIKTLLKLSYSTGPGEML